MGTFTFIAYFKVPGIYNTIFCDTGVFGKRKLLYKFGTVQAIKYNPCM